MGMTPQQKMDRAFDELVLKQRFFAVLKSQLKWKPDPTAKTAWTDGKNVGWNPAFIGTLQNGEVLGVVVHEMTHPMFKHHLRRGTRKPRQWNIACDYAVNPKILDWGFKLPKSALIRDDFKGMSAEEIYDILEKEAQQEKQSKQQQQPQSGEGDESEDKSQEGSQSEQEETGDSEDESKQDGGEKEDEQGDSSEDDGGAKSDESEPSETEDAEPQEQEKTEDQEDPTDTDPGECGEVRDAVDDEGNPASEDEKESQSHQWNVAVSQAESIAKMAKQMGDGLKRSIGEILRPEVPWQEILQSFMNEKSREDYSWMKPNRRYIGEGIHLPSLSSNTIGTGVLVIDSSGSIDNEKFTEFVANMRSVLETFNVELFVIVADDRVRWSGYITADQLDTLEALGGWGTDFKPAFNLVEEEGIDPKFLIYFTDLENWSWPEEPYYPTLWACWGSTPNKPPFGTVMMIK